MTLLCCKYSTACGSLIRKAGVEERLMQKCEVTKYTRRKILYMQYRMLKVHNTYVVRKRTGVKL